MFLGQRNRSEHPTTSSTSERTCKLRGPKSRRSTHRNLDSRNLQRGPSLHTASRRPGGNTGGGTNIDAISLGKRHMNHTESQDFAWEITEEERESMVHRTQRRAHQHTRTKHHSPANTFCHPTTATLDRPHITYLVKEASKAQKFQSRQFRIDTLCGK